MKWQTSALAALLLAVVPVSQGETEIWGTATQVRRSNLRSAGGAIKRSGSSGHSKAISASAEVSNTNLRKDLSDSISERQQLRWRLSEVSREAHAQLAEFEREVQSAKIAAQRSDQRLREEIMQEKSKYYSAHQSLNKLRSELAAARRAESHERAVVAAVKKAEGRAHIQRSEQQASLQEMSRIKVELAAARQATVREHEKLIKSQRTADKAVAEVAAEKAAEKQLQVDMEREMAAKAQAAAKNATAVAEAKAAQEQHRERLGLLMQINELQDQSQKATQQEQAAKNQVRVAEEEAQAKIKAQVNVSKVQDLARQRHIAALLQQTQAARVNLSAAVADVQRAQGQITALKTAIAQKEEQLHVTFLSLTDLRTARDAATKSEASFQQMDRAAEASLKQSREELSSARSQLQEVNMRLAASEKQAATLRAQSKDLQAKLRDLKQDSEADKAQQQYQLHETMIAAASKVHALEDQNDNLTMELHKAKDEITAVEADSSKAKDTLLQETESALKASQRSDALSAELEDVQKASEASRKQSNQLSERVFSLEDARRSAEQAAKAHEQESAKWEAKAEKLEVSEKAEGSKVQELAAANANLTSQVARLSDAEQHATDLEQALANSRNDLQKATSDKVDLKKTVENLRSLTDHYSAEFETSRNESDTWRLRAQDLGSELTSAQKQAEGLTHQRDNALQRFKEARSQEDEYFDENTRLEQQNEGLITKLNDVSASANQSIASSQTLKAKVDELQSEQSRERQNSHLAWERTEKELLQAHKDLQVAEGLAFNLKAELSRTQAVLTDKERKILGLPTPDSKAASKDLAAPASADASASHLATSVPLAFHAKQSRDGQSEEPLTPQVSHSKVSKPRSPTSPSAHPVVAASVSAVVSPSTTTSSQVLLPGEPPHVVDDAASVLASVTEAKGSGDAAPAPRSALQRLAEYFASPLPR